MSKVVKLVPRSIARGIAQEAQQPSPVGWEWVFVWMFAVPCAIAQSVNGFFAAMREARKPPVDHGENPFVLHQSEEEILGDLPHLDPRKLRLMQGRKQ